MAVSMWGNWKRTITILCVVFMAGCAREPATTRFIPPAQTARQALEAALRSWQKGHPAGRVQGEAPEIYLVDACRRPGQTLESFTILGEAPGEGPRCFATRLRLQNPPEEQRVRFVVFGIDPLWVYRYEDYEMLIHWECRPSADENKSARSPQ